MANHSQSPVASFKLIYHPLPNSLCHDESVALIRNYQMVWLPGDPLLPNFFCETIYSSFDYYYISLSLVPGLEGYSQSGGIFLTFPRSSCSKVLTTRNACHIIPPSLSLYPLLACHLLISHYLSTVRLFYFFAPKERRLPSSLPSVFCLLVCFICVSCYTSRSPRYNLQRAVQVSSDSLGRLLSRALHDSFFMTS